MSPSVLQNACSVNLYPLVGIVNVYRLLRDFIRMICVTVKDNVHRRLYGSDILCCISDGKNDFVFRLRRRCRIV
jgi:hypothetical protein